MAITADAVMALRQATAAGMMDCKHALEETRGEVEQATDWLRMKGVTTAVRRTRVAKRGLVAVYVHHNRQSGALVELNSDAEADATSDQLQHLAHEIALHVAAAEPNYLRGEDVPTEIEEKRAGFETQAREQQPQPVMENIVEGKLNAFFQREVLLEQAWARDDKKSVEQLAREASTRLGERITISRFARFKVGEARSPSIM